VVANASGFLYYVSIAGVTGTKSFSQSDVAAALARIRAASELPVCVGFGIRTPQQAAAIAAIADGAVVGSAIVGRIADTAGQPRDKILAAVLELTAALAASTPHAKVSA
jgi:tryptophan synthase alpha chain